jgi:crotonobetainyl-CoA:carnitine CoA-transferase CaiB-like acyl-CoA transferase
VKRRELESLLEDAFSTRSSVHWLERLREADVPASLVLDYAGLAREEQPAANQYIVEQDHPRFGRQRIVGLHIQLSETPGEPGAPAPLLGEHTRESLLALGLSSAEVDTLEGRGVVGPAGGSKG